MQDYGEIKKVIANFELGQENIQSIQADPYVLIIDEINRGNVSQIFGELITLIEKDKRAGKGEALSVTLPYSKERFTVPPNLYIIGTMNTADRSVEALDVALRRRFAFEHMPPDDSLDELIYMVGDTEKTLADLLRILNRRITYLKDEDHQIGHSYLMDKKSPEELRETFDKNIIPLLKEYFYNDYGKIRLVLGDGFMKEEEFPKFPVNDPDLIDQESRYSLKSLDKDFNIIEALKITFEEH